MRQSNTITGNTFKNHRWSGMYFTAATRITISSNTDNRLGGPPATSATWISELLGIAALKAC
jgi:parallel beta-helix repeat protein